MIRNSNAKDLDAIVRIWLDASIIAHDFISADYWKSKVDDMRNVYLPSAETYVFVSDTDEVEGFVSLVDNYLAAIFVNPAQQRHGIGKLLMGYIKRKRSSLKLCVYKDNRASVDFYIRQGFSIVQERVEKDTGKMEYAMEWGEQ